MKLHLCKFEFIKPFDRPVPLVGGVTFSRALGGEQR